MPAHGPEENKEASEFQCRGKRKNDAPIPKTDVRRPAQCDSASPEAPTHPAALNGKRRDCSHFGQRVVADSDDERTDPAEDLRVPVRLNPRRGKRRKRVFVADGDKIPNAQERAWKKHERQPCDHVSRSEEHTSELQ